MTFGAFFDESERLEAKDPLCVAGWVFKPTAYKQFCRKWKAMLAEAKPGGITAFHMKDLVHQKKEFAGLSIQQRQKILQKAAVVIANHAMCAQGALVDQDELEEVCGPDWPDRFGSSYTLLCQRAAQSTAFWLKRRRQFSPIAFTFEKGHKWEYQTDQVFTGIAREPFLRKQYQYGVHTFLLKEDCYGAQAADLWAWAAVRYRVGGSTKSIAAFMPTLEKLVAHFGEDGQIRMYEGESLQAFVDQQRGRSPDAEYRVNVGQKKSTFR